MSMNRPKPRIMNRCLPLALICALLAACATTPEQERAYAEREANRLKQAHGQTCENLGFTPDTDDWRNCLLERENQRLMRYMWDRPYWGFPGYGPYYWPGCFRSGGRFVCY